MICGRVDGVPVRSWSAMERPFYRDRMTEPPRPPGHGNPDDPSADPTVYVPPTDPTAAPPPQPPTSGGGAYVPPPSAGAGGYPPPTSGAGAPPPTSGAGGTPPPPGGPYPPPGAHPSYGQPGYGQPGYGPPGYGVPGYGAPGPGAPGPGYGNTDEKTWAMLVHFGGIVLGFIAPLIGLLAKGNESPVVRAHAVEALNFQITWGIVLLATTVLGFCSFGILAVLVFVPWLVIIVFSVIAGIKANDGVLYRYPATWRVVK